MQWTSILAIYALFWVMTAFISLPFGLRTPDETGDATIPGQAESAPVNFRPVRLVIRSTIIATVLTTLFVLNYEFGWIGPEDINVFPEPPTQTQR